MSTTLKQCLDILILNNVVLSAENSFSLGPMGRHNYPYLEKSRYFSTKYSFYPETMVTEKYKFSCDTNLNDKKFGYFRCCF